MGSQICWDYLIREGNWVTIRAMEGSDYTRFEFSTCTWVDRQAIRAHYAQFEQIRQAGADQAGDAH